MSKTLLLRNARCVATFVEQRRELSDASVFIRGHRIEAIGPAADLADLADQADEVLDLRGRYPIWAGLTPEMVQVSTQVAMAELLLSGCTTSSDHLYIYPNGVRLDDSIEAAQAIGMRFVATRGSMSVGRSQGGLPPDEVVEREDAILRDTQRLIERWHDARHGAMVQVAVAPCSPFSVSRDLMRESALLARAHGVRLHTHLAENDHDIAYSRDKFGCTPAEYAEQLGWVGHDVWHAHCVKLDAAGMSLFARTRTGVAHCPCSNMRLASGIAPIRRMLDAGVPVGLGVDGSASNDGAHMLGEARQAMLLARVGRALEPFGCDAGPAEMKARDALALATRGGGRGAGARRHRIAGRGPVCRPGGVRPGQPRPGRRRRARPRGGPAAVRPGQGPPHRGQRPGGGAGRAAHHAGSAAPDRAPQPPGPAIGGDGPGPALMGVSPRAAQAARCNGCCGCCDGACCTGPGSWGPRTCRPLWLCLASCLARAASLATCSADSYWPRSTRTAPIDSVVHGKKRFTPCRSSASMPPACRAVSSNRARASRANSAMMASQRCCQLLLWNRIMKSSPPTCPTKSRRASQWLTSRRATSRIISSPRHWPYWSLKGLKWFRSA